MVKGISELQSITCCMGPHCITYHPAQVNALQLNPSQTGMEG